jgi:hypothetical protein
MIRNIPKAPKFRGVSLLEAVLALGIGGIVITSSAIGIGEYTTGVRVQATAGMLDRLTKATDRYAEDNYEQLLANAPQELPINVVAPYYASNIRQDAFRNDFVLTTRSYQITVPDPRNPGSTVLEDALQVMVVAVKPPNSELDQDVVLRAEIANTSGGASGFVARDELTCQNAANTAPRPNDHICGSFGAYSFDPSTFPATNFADAAYVGLVTKGDSSVYGDQLYRYNYSDPELNTMHTDIIMEENSILNPNEIDGVNTIRMDAPTSLIEATGSALDITSAGTIRVEAADHTLRIQSEPGFTGWANIEAEGGQGLKLNEDSVTIGDLVPETHGPWLQHVGTGNIYSDISRSEEVRAGAVNSKFRQSDDPLRIQHFRGGEAIIGNRVRYRPTGANSVYEISDGKLMAQHISLQDITCADCGGTLSEILPKWRHMGTYMVVGSATVPKPNCDNNRRGGTVRSAIGAHQMYWDGSSDRRYEQKILVIPRDLGSGNGNDGERIGWYFNAQDWGPNWRVRVDVHNARGNALAATYCVFTGGDANPASASVPPMQTPSTPSSPVWNRIE